MSTLGRYLPYLSLVVAALLIFADLGGSGIWDPWELNAADTARNLIDGANGSAAENLEAPVLREPPLGVALRAQSFSLLGVSETAGRLPSALGAFAMVGLVFLFAFFFLGPRIAGLAAIVASTSPLVLLNARQMLGEGVPMAATTALGLATAFMLFERPRAAGAPDPVKDGRWLATRMIPFVLALGLAQAGAGGLQGMLPPLGAGLITIILMEGCPTQQFKRAAWAAVVGTGGFTVLMVVRAVVADEGTYSAWLGGAPFGGEPPTFEQGLERVFHGFAPWSGLVLPAFALVLATTRKGTPEGVNLLGSNSLAPDPHATCEGEAGDDAGDEVESETSYAEGLPTFLVLWAALAYGSLTVYEARYGANTYLAIAPLALVLGMAIDQVARRRTSAWSVAILGAIFVALALRDFALYPVSPVTGLPISGLEVPEIFNPKRLWTAVLGLFLVFLVLAFGARPGGSFPRPQAAMAWLRTKWSEGIVARVWMVGVALGVLAMLAFGGFTWLASGDAPTLAGMTLSSTGVRIGRVLFFLPFVVVAGAYAAALAFWAVGRFDYGRVLLVPLGGVLVAGYVTFSFQPALAMHFSPREIYDTYNELRGEGEPLAEYHVSGRAGAYYAQGETRTIGSQDDLLEYLASPERTWAVVPADDLAALNRAYRQRTHRHLYVADASSARVLLLASQPIEGKENENFIAETVLSEVPEVQHPVGAVFDERIELVGYNLELPGGTYVGPGQRFAVTWVWRVRQRVPGNYQVFLHIDGAGARMHGDHEPVDGRYPVRLWDEGDVILDRQEIHVPATNRPGRYNFMIGFYAGNNRLSITEGSDDGADRLNAGPLHVR